MWLRFPMDGYSEYVSLFPEADTEVLHDAIRAAVSHGMLWLQQGQTSLFGEDVPEGLIGSDTTLQSPPERVSPMELLPANLQEAWDDGTTTAEQVARALAEKRGEPMPWPLVRDAIDGAFRARYLKRSVRSGEWPTDRAGAEQVIIEVPEEESTGAGYSGSGQLEIDPQGREKPPAGSFGSSRPPG